MTTPALMTRLSVRLRWLGARAVCAVNGGRYRFTDKFGATYFLWPDTRLADSLARGVRIDDEGLLIVVRAIMSAYARRWEASEDEAARRFVGIDVGAFIGVVTLAIAERTRPSDHIVAFEPFKRNWERVRANMALNGLAHVEAVNMAVSDSPREALLKLSRSSSGNFLDPGSTRLDSMMQATGEVQPVRVTSLAAYCADRAISTIDVLKIDAEFQDDAVLRGAGALLTEGRIHYVFAEEPPQNATFSATVLAVLADAGYQVFHIVRRDGALVRDLARYPFKRAKPPLNLFAVSPHAPFAPDALGLTLVDSDG